jgi:hypothetical protein
MQDHATTFCAGAGYGRFASMLLFAAFTITASIGCGGDDEPATPDAGADAQAPDGGGADDARVDAPQTGLGSCGASGICRVFRCGGDLVGTWAVSDACGEGQVNGCPFSTMSPRTGGTIRFDGAGAVTLTNLGFALGCAAPGCGGCTFTYPPTSASGRYTSVGELLRVALAVQGQPVVLGGYCVHGDELQADLWEVDTGEPARFRVHRTWTARRVSGAPDAGAATDAPASDGSALPSDAPVSEGGATASDAPAGDGGALDAEPSFSGVCLGARDLLATCARAYKADPGWCGAVEGCTWDNMEGSCGGCSGLPTPCYGHKQAECAAQPDCSWYGRDQCGSLTACAELWLARSGCAEADPSTASLCLGYASIDLDHVCRGAPAKPPRNCLDN